MCGKWVLPDSEPVRATLLLYRLTPIKYSMEPPTHSRAAGERERGRGREGAGEKNRERKVEEHCSGRLRGGKK